MGKDHPPVTVFVCSRGRQRARCSSPGCYEPHEQLCDWPVTRKGVAGTCDAKLCRTHAYHYGADTDYCGPHARAHEEKARATNAKG